MEEKSVGFRTLTFGQAKLEWIFQQRFSYQKAFTQLNRPVPILSSSPSGEKYAKVILYLESKGLLPQFDDVVGLIRSIYDGEMRRLKLPSSPFGEDNSWINWDLAKQIYFFLSKDRSATNNHYRIADPLSDESKRDEIISRHIGWEFWTLGGCEPWISNPKVRSLVEPSEKQPAAWALAELGALIRSSQSQL
jgi:hypothetical protein